MKLHDLPPAIQDLIATHESVAKPIEINPRKIRQSLENYPNDSNPRISDPSREHSLFGEILDWMFAPLLLIWPLSIGVTFLIARSLADAPFDRVLEDRTTALAQQVSYENRKVNLSLPKSAREILRADEEDDIYFQIIGMQGELLTGNSEVKDRQFQRRRNSGCLSVRPDAVI
jgi:two-component system, OmpR family, sensor histidine kinase TctE